MYVAAANWVGEEYSYRFFSHSAVVGPYGDVLATSDEPMESYSIVRIDLDVVRKAREESQLLQSRQPLAYRAVVRKY